MTINTTIFKISIILLSFILLYHFFLKKSDRDRIMFIDPVEEVTDSIKQMLNFFNYSNKDDLIYKYYVSNNGELYVNGNYVINIKKRHNNNNINEMPAFKYLELNDINRFINLSVFLEKNYIDAVLYSFSHKKIVLNYRPITYFDEEDYRELVYNDGKLSTYVSNIPNKLLLDHNGKLLLYKPIR